MRSRMVSDFPELARQWDEEKNGTLHPSELSEGSHRRVWWRCALGHSWQAEVRSRALDGTGCPVCTGKRVIAGYNDLATHFPQVAEEWAWELNGALRPDQVTPSSNRKVWWRCALGHEWNAVISTRTRLAGNCPYCAGQRVLKGFNDLASRFPELAEEWDTKRNGMGPSEVTSGSSRRVWWCCKYGHVWRAAVYSRTGATKSGCPICAGRGKRKS